MKSKIFRIFLVENQFVVLVFRLCKFYRITAKDNALLGIMIMPQQFKGQFDKIYKAAQADNPQNHSKMHHIVG
jgi:hypothetical protein